MAHTITKAKKSHGCHLLSGDLGKPVAQFQLQFKGLRTREGDGINSGPRVGEDSCPSSGRRAGSKAFPWGTNKYLHVFQPIQRGLSTSVDFFVITFPFLHIKPRHIWHFQFTHNDHLLVHVSANQTNARTFSNSLSYNTYAESLHSEPVCLLRTDSHESTFVQ